MFFSVFFESFSHFQIVFSSRRFFSLQKCDLVNLTTQFANFFCLNKNKGTRFEIQLLPLKTYTFLAEFLVDHQLSE